MGLRPAFPEGTGAAKPVKAMGMQKVQLGAWRTRAEAEAGLAKAKAQAGAVLADVATEIVQANIPGKGRYFRLRVVSLSVREANSLCAGMIAKGLACIRAPH